MTWQPYDHRGRPNTPKSDPKAIAELAEPLRSRVHTLIEDCPWPGELGLVSGLRDPGTQWDLRLARVGLANIWRFPPKGNPTTAVPARWNPATQQWEGGSNHQRGTAADLGGTERAMAWWSRVRESYGLARTVTRERWHAEANGRDVLTGRRHDRPTVTIRPYGEPTTPITPTPDPEDIDVTKAAELEDRIAKLEGRTSRLEKGWEILVQWVKDNYAPMKALQIVTAFFKGKVETTDAEVADLDKRLDEIEAHEPSTEG